MENHKGIVQVILYAHMQVLRIILGKESIVISHNSTSTEVTYFRSYKEGLLLNAAKFTVAKAFISFTEQ